MGSPPEKKPPAEIRERLADLARRRREILSQPADKALDLILDHPQPTALVHSFPPQDLYLLVREIGPEDALPLLAQASDGQREFILDMEVWDKDRLAPAAMAHWLKLLIAADPARLVPWLAKHKTDLLEFFLFESVEVRIREHDQDPSDFGPGFVTRDDVFYERVKAPPAPAGGRAGGGDPRPQADRETVEALLDRLAHWDHVAYQAILLEAMGVIPAECEEAEYRLRNVRLAEEGFLPFDEAVGVYQPLDPRALEGRLALRRRQGSDPLGRYRVPLQPVSWVDTGSRFGGALEKIEPGEILYQVQAEFASLCNQVAVADQRALRDFAGLRAVVRKVCGYLSIGLAAADVSAPDPVQAAALLRRYPLADLFRVGFGRALALKRRARAWIAGAWFRRADLPLTFWGESWTGVLGGLLIKKPLCFDPAGKEGLYREFETMEDIRLAAEALDDAIAVDRLLGGIDARLESPGLRRGASYKNLLLTLWARDALGPAQGAGTPPLTEAVPLERFRDFFRKLFPAAPAAGEPRRIPREMKSSFLLWLESAAGMPGDEIADMVGGILEALFTALEEEYGRVAAEDLDPRFMPHFILRV